MHELSIARSVLDMVKQNVAEKDLPKVRSIMMRIGELAGVMPDSLEFCYQALTSDTLLSQSSLCIERVPFQIECQQCHQLSLNERGFAFCPLCGSSNTTLLSGDELHVAAIELNETAETVHERVDD